ncbi:MAG TPA: hypothetical protein VJ783_02820 [Pirellulales bacterium]|nr:hypothetical protein [Pirellulales bacterium]
MIEEHRLADVGAAHHRHHQQRRQLELREQFVLDQREPFFLGGRAQAQRLCGDIQVGQRPMQSSDLTGPGVIIGGLRAQSVNGSVYEWLSL